MPRRSTRTCSASRWTRTRQQRASRGAASRSLSLRPATPRSALLTSPAMPRRERADHRACRPLAHPPARSSNLLLLLEGRRRQHQDRARQAGPERYRRGERLAGAARRGVLLLFLFFSLFLFLFLSCSRSYLVLLFLLCLFCLLFHSSSSSVFISRTVLIAWVESTQPTRVITSHTSTAQRKRF